MTDIDINTEKTENINLDNTLDESIDKSLGQATQTELEVVEEINQEEFKKLKLVLEAILMAENHPVTLKRFTDLLDEYNNNPNTRVKEQVKFNKKYLQLALDELITDYEDRAIEVKNLNNNFRIQTRPEYAVFVQSIWQEKPSRYSKATLETLAIIAYRQPITRGEIEHIRGVAVSSQIVRNLLDREWIKVVGHKEVPGRPAIYATTQNFLHDLNIGRLEDLPALADIKDIKDKLSDNSDLNNNLIEPELLQSDIKLDLESELELEQEL